MGAEVIGALENVSIVDFNENGLTHKTNHLDASLLKFVLEFGKRTQLSSANWSKVCGVGEEDCPAVVDELVEVNLSMRGKSLEVGSYLSVSKPLAFDAELNLPVDPNRRRGCS